MFLIYNVLLVLLSPIWLPIMYLRSLQRKGSPNWKERFGTYSLVPSPINPTGKPKRIWVHAVSVGEVLAVRPILEGLRASCPEHEIVLSCTTSSGHETALAMKARAFKDASVSPFDQLIYFPIDVARFTLSAIQQVRPEAILIMETELWMNFLWAAKAFDSRVLLINGRISDKSFARSKSLKSFYKALFKNVDRVLVQSQVDKVRFIELGFDHPEVLGNIKFDQAQVDDHETPSQVREFFGLKPQTWTLVIGSTRGEIEEKLIGEMLGLLSDAIRTTIQVIHAPRHIERAVSVEKIAEQHGFKTQFRSETTRNQETNYLILDTYGELQKAYLAADVVIIGGGFDKLGGQNLIQPLAAGKPVIVGPNMNNFADATSMAKKANAVIEATGAQEIADAIESLYHDKPKCAEMGTAAKYLVQSQTGSVRLYLNAVVEELEKYQEINAKRMIRPVKK